MTINTMGCARAAAGRLTAQDYIYAFYKLVESGEAVTVTAVTSLLMPKVVSAEDSSEVQQHVKTLIELRAAVLYDELRSRKGELKTVLINGASAFALPKSSGAHFTAEDEKIKTMLSLELED